MVTGGYVLSVARGVVVYLLIIIIKYGLNVVDPSVLYCALRARVSFRCLISILLHYVTLQEKTF